MSRVAVPLTALWIMPALLLATLLLCCCLPPLDVEVTIRMVALSLLLRSRF